MVLFSAVSGVRTVESSGFMERAMGIEPTSEAWEASILPLYDARSIPKLAKETISRKLALRNVLISEATHQVIVHQAGGLHQRVDNRWPHEAEAALLQILA